MIKPNTLKLINQWKESLLVSEQEKQEIKNLSDEELNLYFDDKDLQFGTAGIRSIVGVGTQRLNKHVYKQIATGYAQYLKISSKKAIPKAVIFHDNRFNGDVFAYECAKVLAAYKIEVYLAPYNKLLPTPLISYCIRKLKADGGINITASHNPKAYNGFKSYNKYGSQLIDSESKIVIENMPKADQIFDVKSKDSKTLIKYLKPKLLNQYFNEIAAHLPQTNAWDQKDLNVVFSSHHGTSSQIMESFIKQLGYVNFIEYDQECNITSDFSDSEITNPEDVKSFEPLLKFAQKHNSNYVMACDPDADRFSFGEKQPDSSWHFFNGNETGILFANYLLHFKHKNSKKLFAVASYVTNNFIDRLFQNKVEVIRCGTGFKWICHEVEKNIKNKTLLIAFEEAIGALLFPINREKDGFQSVALILEMIHYYQKQNLTLLDVLNQLFTKFGYWKGQTDSFWITQNNWKELMNQKLNLLKQHPLTKIGSYQLKEIKWNTVNDCLDFILNDDNWLRFRLSGTEPKFKIYYNLYGLSKQDVENKFAEVQKYLINFLGL